MVSACYYSQRPILKVRLMCKQKRDREMQQFQADLLQSVRDMKAGHAGRVHRSKPTAFAQENIKSGRKPSQVSKGISVSKKLTSVILVV